jgi:hypothetical protein
MDEEMDEAPTAASAASVARPLDTRVSKLEEQMEEIQLMVLERLADARARAAGYLDAPPVNFACSMPTTGPPPAEQSPRRAMSPATTTRLPALQHETTYEEEPRTRETIALPAGAPTRTAREAANERRDWIKGEKRRWFLDMSTAR